jgi:hypothetical protein
MVLNSFEMVCRLDRAYMKYLVETYRLEQQAINIFANFGAALLNDIPLVRNYSGAPVSMGHPEGI